MIHQTESESPQPVAEAGKLGGGCLSRLVRLFRSTGSAKVEPVLQEIPEMAEEVKRWNDYEDSKPIEMEFEYLGVKMAVVRIYHYGYDRQDQCWVGGKVYCEYADAFGAIHEKGFLAVTAMKFLPNTKRIHPHPQDPQ